VEKVRLIGNLQCSHSVGVSKSWIRKMRGSVLNVSIHQVCSSPVARGFCDGWGLVTGEGGEVGCAT